MAVSQDTVEAVRVASEYKYGFVSDIDDEAVFIFATSRPKKKSRAGCWSGASPLIAIG